MKKIVIIIMLCGVYYGYAQNTPPYAASTQTWAFGPQIWSDAIHMPECNKSIKEFKASSTEPQCCCDTNENGKIFYYYNWIYVKKNMDKMCPAPWTLPTWNVVVNGLIKFVDRPSLIGAWGYGGYVTGSPRNQFYNPWEARYWLNETQALYYNTKTYGQPNNLWTVSHGYQVRCVK
jgi:hypothetical protein